MIQGMFNWINGAKIYLELDFMQVFHQIHVEEESIHILAFTAPNGKSYVLVRMPFGLKDCPTHFQNMIDQVQMGMVEFALAYNLPCSHFFILLNDRSPF